MRALAAGAFLLVVANGAAAQESQVRVQPGPHYAGLPIEIELTASGFEEAPTPEVSLPHPPAHGQLEQVEVSPQVSSSVVIVNGQVTESRVVRFLFRYRYLTSQPGAVEVGPFVLRQGAREHRAPPVALRIREVPQSDRFDVDLEIGSAPVYVGARVPVTLELRLAEEFQKRVHGYTLRAPLFDLSESFRFLDPEEGDGRTSVGVETASGTLQLPGRVESEQSGEERFVVIRVERTAVPLEPGRYEVAAASAIVEEAIRWKRDLFGRRRATHVRRWRASDDPLVLEVRALPTSGRPPSFAGAVGRGFTLDLSADRTVVEAGEPITLTLTVRGAGNLESVGLPRLDAEGLLPGDRFRVPERDLAGSFDGREKRFQAVVRVLDEDVKEIPALTYSWFNPETERYESTRSRPIALSVRSARRIGAEDVVAAPSRGRAAPPSLHAAEDTPSRLAMTGADLSIETDPERLLGTPPARAEWLVAGLYLGSLALVALSLWERRRRREDPEAARARKRLVEQERRIREAARLPAREGSAVVADALRRMLAELAGGAQALRDEGCERLIAECDARSYAPAGSADTETLDRSLHARGMEAARRLLEHGS